ncbi:hypothetical protein [Nocardia terpenica]|uniref:Uncharacterized protein n=1 Tax=Nocardia terpenica TaxID=455432 RepID=A0A6G9ZDX9_9NOCA|nr:hypothetical protein [Nocardia terpenica]QIS23611.1 hypothetical protein F6W96_40440 [Nocardia terpenica]
MKPMNHHSDRGRSSFARRHRVLVVAAIAAALGGLLAATGPTAPPAAAQGYIPCDQWQQMHPGWPCIDTPPLPSAPPGPPTTPPPLPTAPMPGQPQTNNGSGTNAGALTPPPVAPGNRTPIVPAPGEPGPPPPRPGTGSATGATTPSPGVQGAPTPPGPGAPAPVPAPVPAPRAPVVAPRPVLHPVDGMYDPPPADEGPTANGCKYCQKDDLGNVTVGDVGDKPDRSDSGQNVYHWYLDKTTPRGISKSPVSQNPVTACSYGDKNTYTVTYSQTAINASTSEAGGGVSVNGLSGDYKVTTSTSTNKELTKSIQVDCSKYTDIAPGTRREFYQEYARTDWEGHWDLESCALLTGCKVIASGPASGTFYAPMPKLDAVDVPDPK